MSGKGRRPGPTGKSLPAAYSRIHLAGFGPGEIMAEATAEAQLAQFVHGEVAKEALLRGATPVQVINIVLQQKRELDLIHSAKARSRWHFVDVDFTFNTEQFELTSLLPTLLSAYDEKVRREFDSLPAGVQRAFVSKEDLKAAKKAASKEEREAALYGGGLHGYRRMRPAYYQNGYTNPADFMTNISPGKILGFEISGGAHDEFLGRLGDWNSGLAKVLDDWSRGLAKRTAEELGASRKYGADVGGFEPRLRAVPNPYHYDGTPLLSNHAFGCAIDVDATRNPQIIGRELINILRDVTGYDFNPQIVPEDPKISHVDRYAQIHLLQSDASNRLKEWLNKYLPIYEENEAELALPPKPGTKPKPNFVDPATPGQCRDMDATTAEAMYKLTELVTLRGLDTIRGWAKHGIQNLPVTFVAAMAKVGLKWGSCYGGSKDIMHFELIKAGTNDDTFVEPDCDRRPLRALLARWGQAEVKSKGV